MKCGIILGFFYNLFVTVFNWFENSFFRKIQIAVANFWSKISKNSIAVSYFTAFPNYKEALFSSHIYMFFHNLFHTVKKHCENLFERVEDIYFISKLLFAARNILNVSIRVYGMGCVGFAAALFAVSLVLGGLTLNTAVASAAAIITGIFFICINKSVSCIFKGSIISKFAASLFGYDYNYSAININCNKACTAWYTGVGAVFGGLTAWGGIPALAVIFAVLAMFLLIYDYRIGIFAALIIMPFAPTMLVVAAVMASFAAFLFRLLFDKKTVFVHTPLDVLVVLFIFVLAISAVTSFARGNSITIFLVYMAFGISYFLVTNAVKGKKQLYALITGMLFAGLGVALYGIYQHIFGFAGGDTWIDKEMFEDISTRVISTFGNPNVLGEYLLLLIPVCCGFIFARNGGFNKFAALCITGALCLCMIYTYSRGNWVGLMVAMALFFMFYDGRIVWLGIIAAFFAPLLMPQTIIDRFLSVGDTSDSSTSYRVYIWIGTLNMLRDYWLCGVGLGSEAFNLIYPFYSYSGIVAPHSHNLYLQIITENGVMGILVFLILIIVYYRSVISSAVKCRDKMLKAVIIGLAAGMFGYLVQGMFDNVWYNYRIVFMFYIIISLTECAVNIAVTERE